VPLAPLFLINKCSPAQVVASGSVAVVVPVFEQATMWSAVVIVTVVVVSVLRLNLCPPFH